MTATSQLLPNVFQTWTDSNGIPLNGGKLYSYAAGTTTPQATYTDETSGTPNANPVVFSSAGQASVWLRTDLAYKLKLTDSLNNVLWTTDNVSIINPSSVDKTKIAANIAGIALLQNGIGAIDVQVDSVTIEVTGYVAGVSPGTLNVKAGGISADTFSTSSKLEVLVKRDRDFSNPGLVQYIPQYQWSSPTLLTDPGTLPPAAATVAKWSPTGEFLAVGHGTTPFITIYQLLGTTLTKLPNPLTLTPTAVRDLSWSACGDFLAVAYTRTVGNNTTVSVYQRQGNSFPVLGANPGAVGPGTSSSNVAFSPNSDFLASTFTVSGTPGVEMWERSAGTTFTDVTTASTIANIKGAMAWSPDSALFLGIDTVAGGINAYSRADSLFTSITSPVVTSYLTDITGMAFSPDGKFLAVAVSVTPYILIFSVTGTGLSAVFAQLSNPGTLPAGAANCVAWSANSQYLIVGHATTPFMTVYSVSGTTFTKQADPGVVPAAAVVSADWTQTKQFLAVASATSPYVQVYKTASTLPSNALLWTRSTPNV